MGLTIREADPQGPEALALLHLAAVEARALYPELHPDGSPWPTNPPAPAGGVYLLAYIDGAPVGMGALRPLDERTAEVRRMFVRADARRHGVARVVLADLEERGQALGYTRFRLETGFRQQPAMALYQAQGYRRIPPFGPYVGDPTSVCFEKELRV